MAYPHSAAQRGYQTVSVSTECQPVLHMRAQPMSSFFLCYKGQKNMIEGIETHTMSISKGRPMRQ